MPTLPDVAPQVMPGVRLGTQASAGAYGAGVGDSVQSIGDATEQLFRSEEHAADEVASLAAINKVAAWKNEALHNPKTGILNQQTGPNADKAIDQTLNDYRKVTSELAKGLTSERQKKFFSRAVESDGTDLTRTLYQYASKQQKGYADEQTTGVILNAQQSATNNAITPLGTVDKDRIDLELQKQQAAILDAARRNGTPPEVVNRQMQVAASTTNMAIINRMVDGGLNTEAQDWFSSHRQDMTPDQQHQVEGQIREGVQRKQALIKSDEIIRSDSGQTRSSAFAASSKISDPDERLRVENRLDQHFARRDQAQREINSAQFKEATDALDASGGDLSAIPVQQWQQFDLEDRQRLEMRSQQLTKKTEVPDGSPKYWEIRQMMSVPALARQFNEMDLTKLNAVMSKRDLDDLMNKQASFRKEGANADSIKGINSEEQVITQALLGAGIDPAMNLKNPDLKRVTAFRNALDVAVQAESAQQKRPLRPEEVGKIAGKLMSTQRITKTGLFWDSQVEVPLFEVPGFTNAALSVDQVPQDKRAKIEARFKTSGVPYVDQDVISAYNDSLNPNSATNAAPPAPRTTTDSDSPAYYDSFR